MSLLLKKVCQGREILSSGVNSLGAIVLVQASIQAKDLSLFTPQLMR